MRQHSNVHFTLTNLRLVAEQKNDDAITKSGHVIKTARLRSAGRCRTTHRACALWDDGRLCVCVTEFNAIDTVVRTVRQLDRWMCSKLRQCPRTQSTPSPLRNNRPSLVLGSPIPEAQRRRRHGEFNSGTGDDRRRRTTKVRLVVEHVCDPVATESERVMTPLSTCRRASQLLDT